MRAEDRLAVALSEWRDAGAPVSDVVRAIRDMTSRPTTARLVSVEESYEVPDHISAGWCSRHGLWEASRASDGCPSCDE